VSLLTTMFPFRVKAKSGDEPPHSFREALAPFHEVSRTHGEVRGELHERIPELLVAQRPFSEQGHQDKLVKFAFVSPLSHFSAMAVCMIRPTLLRPYRLPNVVSAPEERQSSPQTERHPTPGNSEPRRSLLGFDVPGRESARTSWNSITQVRAMQKR